MDPIRPARRGTTVLMLLATLVLILFWVLPGREHVLLPLARATGWAVAPDLVAGGVMIGVVVGGILLGYGGLRAADVGLVRAHLPAGLVVTAALWAASQLVLGGAAMLSGESLGVHPGWTNPGPVPTLGFLLAMLVGMAVFEEVAFRGYLFRQLLLRAQGSGIARLAVAALASSVLFALVHIPTRMILAQHPWSAMPGQMVGLTMAGLVGVAVYVRTRNLFVVIGVHALVNAPTPVWDAPVAPFPVTAALTLALCVIWPWLEHRLPGEAAGSDASVATDAVSAQPELVARV